MTVRILMDLSTKQGRKEQGQRIQQAVERAKLSIEELANRIGCSRALIYQYIAGSTLAQADRLQQIAAECNVPLTYFYSDTEEEQTAGRTGTEAEREAAQPVAQDVAARLAESLRTLQELADAQEGPPDYRALATTCERLLFLAAQLGDRQAQARAQFRLGNARLRMADFPRAADALRATVALAAEIGLVTIETGARQSLGNALLAMGNVNEAREQFARIAAGQDFAGRWQGTLSIGAIYTLHGEYQQAMERFDEAANILEEGEASGQASHSLVATAMLYVNTNRRSIYLNGGDFRAARTLAEKGLSDAEAIGNADQHLEARFDMAWSDFCLGQWTQAYRGLTTTLQLARFVGDQGRETMARALIGIFLAAAGDFDEAIGHGKDAVSMALSRGDRRAELNAHLALADAYTAQTHRESEVRYHTNQALAVATALRHERAEIECRLRLARLCLQAGDLPGLREAARRALEMARRLGTRHLESLARCWLAEGGDENLAEGSAAQEAELALQIAEETELVEGRWRAHRALATVALNASDIQKAEANLRSAIGLLESLRAALIAAGLADTLLENDDCINVYGRLARLLLDTGRREEATAFLEQTGWPPLTAWLNSEVDVSSERG